MGRCKELFLPTFSRGFYQVCRCGRSRTAQVGGLMFILASIVSSSYGPTAIFVLAEYLRE